MRIFYIFVLFSFLLSACVSSSDSEDTSSLDANIPPVTGGSWYRPAVLDSWQWQLQGVLNTTYNVDIYDIDLFDTSSLAISNLQASGKKVICYFSAGSYENWRPDAGQFEASELGNTLDGWAGERWLDIRSSNVMDIMLARLDLAQSKGCDGVEPDNMDAYQNSSGFALSASDQLAYNRLIANAAHNRDLAVALKNDLDQVAQLVDYYDLAVNEECFYYSECNALTPFTYAGKPVLQAEYDGIYKAADTTERDAMCAESLTLQFSTLVLPLDLDDSYRDSCL